MESIGLAGEANAGKRLTVMRAIDKLDRLGVEGVRQLLGQGRKDESGDFTRGAGLDSVQIEYILAIIQHQQFVAVGKSAELETWNKRIEANDTAKIGFSEMRDIERVARVAGYGADRIRIDPSIVRGLEYYTGPVYEVDLTFPIKDDDGKDVRFGSVGGGGRYDGLVERFRGIEVPATGFSIGVSRLYTALDHLGALETATVHEPVVVLVMDRDRIADYQTLAGRLRQAGIRAEMYLGGSGMKAQMKYADRRNAPCVVIQGGDERERGEVTIKDLIEGSRLSAEIEDNVEWREGRPAQVSVPETRLVEAVKDILARHRA
jgi:histidyl-tRNA synthetase